MYVLSCKADAKVVITATKAVIGDKELPLMKNIDEVLAKLVNDDDASSSVNHVLVAMTDDDTTSIGDHIHLEKVSKLCEFLSLHVGLFVVQ